MVIGVVHAAGAAKYVHSRRKRIYPLVCVTVLCAAEQPHPLLVGYSPA